MRNTRRPASDCLPKMRLAVGVAAALVLAGPIGTSPAVGSRPTTESVAPQPLRPPLVYRSVNGVLAVTIVAAPTRVKLGGTMIDGATYNGTYAGADPAAEAGRHAPDALHQ